MRQAGTILSRGLLVALFLLFAHANFVHWRATGNPSGLGTTVLEGWVALLFLVRRSTDRISTKPLAWVAAPIGSFGMLLARPSEGGLPHLPCELVQIAGVAVAFVSLATLGRSFGLVAANRGIKQGGPYRVVRHPAYTGYLIAYVGYLLENPSLPNVALFCLSTAFQLLRIREEESLLTSDRSYAAYRTAVRYRLVPLVY
jgi:protein-S-isoprenylcysteine O-methyltransferase Ste14